MKKPRILLTGGSGMVGCNLLEHPKVKGYELLFPCRKELDLCDLSAVLAYLSKTQPDIVIHLAGRVGGIHANIREPVSFLVENLDIGRNIILGSRKVGIKRLINLGSSCMYPRNQNQPLAEEMILKGELEPTNEGYALAKIVTARICSYIMREDINFHYKTLIPCNLYGRFDKFHPTNSHLIPAIIYKIHQAKVQGLHEVNIWGDGTARREFMYAGDFVDALLQGLEDFDQLPDLMNIGLGYDYSVNEYYTAVAQVVGWKGNFVHNIGKPTGMDQKLVDITRQRNWGWASDTPIMSGIEKAYQFYLERQNYDL